MSLTREQWLEMWISIKKIESEIYFFPMRNVRVMRPEVDKIKSQIQSVIGQME